MTKENNSKLDGLIGIYRVDITTPCGKIRREIELTREGIALKKKTLEGFKIMPSDGYPDPFGILGTVENLFEALEEKLDATADEVVGRRELN
jgi:hypothetical protein